MIFLSYRWQVDVSVMGTYEQNYTRREFQSNFTQCHRTYWYFVCTRAEKVFNYLELSSQCVFELQIFFSKQILHQLMKESNSPHVSFEYLSSNLVTIDGEMVCINRLSTVGEFGFELHIPKQSCEKIYQLVRKCGSKYNMKLAGYRALSSLNCEKGRYISSKTELIS